MESGELAVRDVADLLHAQYAIITGGKSRDGCPIITFPDLGNFCTLGDAEYQRLVQYLTSVPSMQEADSGFVLVVDRRNDKWNSVKTVLLKISGFFPGLIHVVYVLRPAGFLQKAISEVSNKLFKEEFKFKVIVCNCVEELHEYIEKSQLTSDLGGEIPYCHQEWIQQRALEKFSCNTQEVSAALDSFTQSLQDTEFPNDVDATQLLLNQQGLEYSELKEEILNAAKHGEDLLNSIRQRPTSSATATSFCANIEDQQDLYRVCPYRLGNVTAVERLLVQLEETERTFDDFWLSHSARLRQCLELRRFEQDFKELQGNFDSHLKTVCEMTEVGETVARVDTLIRETTAFQKLCMSDIERAEELISTGQQLLNSRHYCALDSVQPKCSELQRICQLLSERLESRLSTLSKCRELQERIDKANRWCTRGVDLLASQHIEKCSTSPELAEQSLHEIQQYVASAEEFKLSSPKEFRSLFQDSITPETKALVTQVLQRIDDVSMMCEKRMASLKRLTLKPPRPVQTVTPEPAVPLQQPIASHHAHNHCGGGIKSSNKVFRKANTLPKIEMPTEMWQAQAIRPESCDTTGSSPDSESSNQDMELLRTKQGHVLAELMETERVYVSELGSIIKGYKCELQSSEMQSLIPPALVGKSDVLFGNLEELYSFHSEVFLRDLDNCISNTELVALCFTQRRDAFLRLYSFYCQNIPRSERLRETVGEKNMFFQACQLKLGHKLPLAAYLLKPVQRITKYQLLLKDLLRYSEDRKCCKELQEALECMLVVLKCVNDSMHQIAITGFWGELCDQGELLMQGSFSVWTDSKKDRLRELRLKPMQRHIFLYQKAMLFCKKAAKEVHNKDTYHFKRYLKMSQIGLTESVKGDNRKFEVWLQGRQEVHTIQALTVQQKEAWVCEIKRVLLEQLAELKGEKIRQYSLASTGKPVHRPLRQTSSWESHPGVTNNMAAFGVDMDTNARHTSIHLPQQHTVSENGEEEGEGGAWSSDYSNSEDEDMYGDHNEGGGRFTALADYCAMGHSEVSMHEGDSVELLKVGCAGWWYVRVIGSHNEGWAPSAYLEPIGRKSLRSSQSVSSQDGSRSSSVLPAE